MASATNHCETLDDVRENIDRLDAKIVELLAERMTYVHEAARFKNSREGVIVPSRINEIVSKVRAMAEGYNADPDLMENIYRSMIDAYIASEQKVWDDIND